VSGFQTSECPWTYPHYIPKMATKDYFITAFTMVVFHSADKCLNNSNSACQKTTSSICTSSQKHFTQLDLDQKVFKGCSLAWLEETWFFLDSKTPHEKKRTKICINHSSTSSTFIYKIGPHILLISFLSVATSLLAFFFSSFIFF